MKQLRHYLLMVLLLATAFNSLAQVTVPVRIFIDGYYIGGGEMKPVLLNEQVAGALITQTDLITVELHNKTSPHGIVSIPVSGYIDIHGYGSFTFSAAPDDYYIVIKHRNAVETWSAVATPVSADTPLYNFTSAKTQAYGDNMLDVFDENLWSFYNGDIDRDGICQVGDFNLLEADAIALATGHYASDFNGDGVVDATDYNHLEYTMQLLAHKISPP